ncbi:MAG TPA: hypothetical protein VFQ48_03025 [Pseudonocardiaceae bacterium]|jgi:hypothetical protein|nr:hypothetical protein [Pseudonocardiaceae bacterium]
MADDDQRPVPAEGRSRGATIHSGGEQDFGAPLPPYKDLKGEEGSGEDFTSQGHGAPPREGSKEESEGVPVTDTSGASPLGVGDSDRAPGNEEMYGESAEALREARMGEGVGRQAPIDAESPDMRVGDQGG